MLAPMRPGDGVASSAVSAQPESEVLVGFVPDLVRIGLARPDWPPPSSSLRSVILLADISGFTALGERGAQQGPAGVERLSTVLNGCFGELVDIVLGHGGDVVKFAGDALLGLWHEGTLPQWAEDAVGCALTAQESLHAMEKSLEEPVSMRIGVAAGAVDIAYLGGVGGRFELVLSGEAVQEVADATQAAAPGQVAVSGAVWEALEGRGRGTPAGEVVVVERLDRSGRGPRLPTRAPLPAEASRLRAFVGAAVLGRLDAGQTAWLAELRRLSVIFVALPGLSDDPPGYGQSLVCSVQEILGRFEGTLDKLAVDEKGIMAVGAFGLPPLAHEDDAARAVQAALAAAETLEAHGCPGSVGVATGRVFCGAIGNERRREYTMIGDAVNRAARLMQAGSAGSRPHTILCDEATQLAAGGAIDFSEPAALRLKGIAGTVLAYPPVGTRRADRRPAAELVGRAPERALLARAVDEARSGRRIVLVEGEAGIGKSILLHDLLNTARRGGLRPFGGFGDPVRRSLPYHPWRAVFTEVLGPGLPAGIDPELVPLLGAVVPVGVPESGLTAGMSAAERAESTVALLTDQLARAASDTPLAVLLDDVHWADSASWALALRVGREVEPLLLVLASRPFEGLPPPEYRALLADPQATVMRLEPLAPPDAEALVARRLGVARLPEAVATFISERASGHPFFSEELALALRDNGMIEVSGGECRVTAPTGKLAALGLPDTVEGVITSRIDRVPPAPQLTLKVASVIGRRFLVDTVRSVHPIDADRPEVPGHLDQLSRDDLTLPDAPEPEAAYAFRHAITQQVAYNLMTFAQRRSLHGAVAEHYESGGVGNLEAAVLGRHWDLAGDPARAIPHLARGGAEALEAGAYHEAIGLLTRALALQEEVGGHGDRIEVARWHQLAGSAHLLAGQLNESFHQHGEALRGLGRPFPARKGTLAVAVGVEMGRQTVHRLFPGRFVARRAPSEAALLATHSLEDLMEVSYHRMDTTAVLYCIFRHLNLAEAHPPSPQLARSYACMPAVASFVSLRGLADRYAALAGEALGPDATPADRGHVEEYEAFYRAPVGQWHEANLLLEAAAERFARVGNRRRWFECQTLLGFVAFLSGRLDRARVVRDALYPQAVRHDDIDTQGLTLIAQGQGALREGRLDDAAGLLERAELLRDDLGRDQQIMLFGTVAAVRMRQGRQAEAVTAAARAQALVPRGRPPVFYLLDGYAAIAEVALTSAHASSEGLSSRQAVVQLNALARAFPVGEPRARLWRGIRHWQAGQRRRARRTWRAGLTAAQRLDMSYDRGLLEEALGSHLPQDDPARPAHLLAAVAAFEAAGAVPDRERALALLGPR